MDGWMYVYVCMYILISICDICTCLYAMLLSVMYVWVCLYIYMYVWICLYIRTM